MQDVRHNWRSFGCKTADGHAIFLLDRVNSRLARFCFLQNMRNVFAFVRTRASVGHTLAYKHVSICRTVPFRSLTDAFSATDDRGTRLALSLHSRRELAIGDRTHIAARTRGQFPKNRAETHPARRMGHRLATGNSRLSGATRVQICRPDKPRSISESCA